MNLSAFDVMAMNARRVRQLVVFVLYAISVALAQPPMLEVYPSNTSSVVPNLVTFAGRLAGPNGQPLTGTVGVTFALYKEEQGGAPLWMETQNLQPDKNGHYKVALGAGSASGLPAGVFASGEARWLEVQAEGQQEQPRLLLVSVPYALKAADAETLGGKPASAFLQAAETNQNQGGAAPLVKQPPIHGSGTTNVLSIWTGTSTLGNSKIAQSGNNVGVGTTSPAATLDVNGNGAFRDTLTLFPKGSNPAFLLNGSAFSVSNSGLVNFISGQTFPGTGSITGVTAGTGLTGGGTGGSVTLNIDTTKIPQLNTSNTFSANQFFNGNGQQMIVGDAGCGAGFAGIGFGGLSGCANYSLLGDGKNTYINRPANGELYIREGNSGEMAIFPGGQASIGLGVAFGLVFDQLYVTPFSQSLNAINAFGYSDFIGAGNPGTTGVIATGGFSSNNNGGDGLHAFGGNSSSASSTGGMGVFAQGGSGGNGGNLINGGPGGVFFGANGNFGGDGILVLAGTGTTLSGEAGGFTGDVAISGNLFAGSKNFKIDHPLDPANKYLVHASVESSEMKNIYDGVIITDAVGEATVHLPDWFEALNTDFRYQLTVLGQFAQAIVGREIQNREFVIRTNLPNVKVSWQVTGVRQDAYAKAHPLMVEEEKDARLRGFYIHPELYGAPAEQQIEWGRHPEMMKHIKQSQEKQSARIALVREKSAKPAQ